MSVLLVEASRSPRERAAESAHPAIEGAMDALGARRAFDACAFPRYASVGVEGPSARVERALGADDEGPWRGYQLARDAFDAMLLDRARAAGADVRVGIRATRLLGDRAGLTGAIVADHEERARFVVDASGARGFLARRLELARQTFSERLFVASGWGPAADPVPSPLFRAEPAGWSWRAPTENGLESWVRLARSAEEAARPPPGAAAARTRAHEVTWRLTRPLAGPGWIVAGDAAAIVDPASGQGVLRALECGAQAARVLHAILRQGAPRSVVLAMYDQWVEDGFLQRVETLTRDYRALGIGLGVGRQVGSRAPIDAGRLPAERSRSQ